MKTAYSSDSRGNRRDDWGFKSKIQPLVWKKKKAPKLAYELDYERSSPKAVAVGKYAEFSPLNLTLDLALNPEIPLTKQEKAIKNLKDCGGKWTSLACNCDNPTLVKFQNFCEIRFHNSPDCVESRLRKAHIKLLPIFQLMKKRKIKSLYMLELGSNRVDYDTLQTDINKWIRKMRSKYGYKMCYIKTQDISNPLQPYFHFHLYLLPEKALAKSGEFIKRARQELNKINPKIMYSQGGWTKLEGCKTYMAKRIAGIFGDLKKDGHFFFEDIMDFDTYLESFHNRKSLSYSKNLPKIWNITRKARLLLAKELAEIHQERCLNCENPLLFAGTDYYSPKPPDYAENIK